MTDHHDPKTAATDDPIDCSGETAQRAGAQKTSLNPDPDHATPDIDKDDISEADLDKALDDSMDASDPPAALQP